MSGVLFNGQTVIRPQVAVAADVSGLTPVVLGSPNIINMFGAALGGRPKTILEFSDPQDAIAALKGGDLLTGMLAAWNASDALPGASIIRAVRVNPALQGTLALAGSAEAFAAITLLNAGSAALLTLTALVSGTGGNSITVIVAAGTSSGKKITIAKGAITEVFDNLASVAAAVTAIQGVSVLVSAALVLEGTLAVLGSTALTGGVTSSTVVTLTSLDYGVYVNAIKAKVEAGSVSGKKLTISYPAASITEVFDNLADGAAMVAAVNAPVVGSTLVSAALTNAGTLSNAVYAFLASGSEGSLTNSDWTDGFNLIEGTPSDLYYAVTSDQSVHDLLIAQVNAISLSKYPGYTVVGHALGLTLAQIKALQVPYASAYRVIISAGGIKHFDSTGAVVTYANYLTFAPQLCGLIAGLAINRSPTYKTLRGLGLELALSSANLDDLDQHGVCAVESVPNVGLRLVNGQTTWTSTLNVMNRGIAEGRIRDVVQVTMKTNLVEFVGEPGTRWTLAGIKARVNSIMMELEANGLITPGVDNAGNAQPSYRNIVVTFNSATQVVTVSVECSPTTTIRYILATTHFTATNVVA